MFVILECKLDTIIAVLHKVLAAFFVIKRSAIGNFSDRYYGFKKKGSLKREYKTYILYTFTIYFLGSKVHFNYKVRLIHRI